MISFMEIYNECAYDLLDKKHLELPLENWSKVFIQLKYLFIDYITRR